MIYKRLTGLPWQVIDDKVVIIDPKSQMVHELNEVGAFIWQQLDGQNNTETISDLIFDDFQCDLGLVAEDVQNFCDSLLKQGLVECL